MDSEDAQEELAVLAKEVLRSMIRKRQHARRSSSSP